MFKKLWYLIACCIDYNPLFASRFLDDVSLELNGFFFWKGFKRENEKH